MKNQKTVMEFRKESDNRWYLVCPEYEEKVTKEFRSTHSYLDEEGKTCFYEDEQDFSNPLDDHTKHPDWKIWDPHRDLVMTDSFVRLLQSMGGKKPDVIHLDVIAYGFVANTYVLYHRTSFDETGADYELIIGDGCPEKIRVSGFCYTFYDRCYPEYFHFKAVK